MGESYRKKWWLSTGKQKRYSRKTAGGVASAPPPPPPPVPARVKVQNKFTGIVNTGTVPVFISTGVDI